MEPLDFEEVTNLGRMLYTAQDAARILEMPEAEVSAMLNDVDSDFFRAYWRGYYETETSVRASTIRLAAAGSGPAQAMVKRWMDQSELSRDHA